jgi:hypothetical protein
MLLWPTVIVETRVGALEIQKAPSGECQILIYANNKHPTTLSLWHPSIVTFLSNHLKLLGRFAFMLSHQKPLDTGNQRVWSEMTTAGSLALTHFVLTTIFASPQTTEFIPLNKRYLIIGGKSPIS